VYQGLRTPWLGMLRVHLQQPDHGPRRCRGIAFDSPELAPNVITGALYCTGSYPKPSFGDSRGKPNIALHGKFGQRKKL